MFTKDNFASIDKSYFNVISEGCFVIVLQSKNTGHFWVLQSGTEHPTCNILHKHNEGDVFHLHGHARELAKAIEDIKDHDSYQLRGRKKQ